MNHGGTLVSPSMYQHHHPFPRTITLRTFSLIFLGIFPVCCLLFANVLQFLSGQASGKNALKTSFLGSSSTTNSKIVLSNLYSMNQRG